MYPSVCIRRLGYSWVPLGRLGSRHLMSGGGRWRRVRGGGQARSMDREGVGRMIDREGIMGIGLGWGGGVESKNR